jgi:DNA-binding GntR family transcriptional regulator
MRRLVDRLETVLTDDGQPPAFEAWSSANAELHRLLVQLAGNERLLKIYDSLHLDVRVLRVFRASGLSPLQEFQAQHRLMLGALEARDAGALQHVVREHIGQATARALATLQMVGGVL